MKNILYISSSINGSASESNALAEHYLAHLGDTDIVHRDLHAVPVPHLDEHRFTAFNTAADLRSPAQREAAELSDSLIRELRAADEVVIAMPMYNLGVPSTFKAWIDHVVRAGETFRYTAEGPIGLLEDRKVTILAARGGVYQDTPLDTQSAYLHDIFALIGLKNVGFIYAEGLGKSALADTARERATASIDALAA